WYIFIFFAEGWSNGSSSESLPGGSGSIPGPDPRKKPAGVGSRYGARALLFLNLFCLNLFWLQLLFSKGFILKKMSNRPNIEHFDELCFFFKKTWEHYKFKLKDFLNKDREE